MLRILILEGSLRTDELGAKHSARPVFPPSILEIEDVNDIGNIIFELALLTRRREPSVARRPQRGDPGAAMWG